MDMQITKESNDKYSLKFKIQNQYISMILRYYDYYSSTSNYNYRQSIDRILIVEIKNKILCIYSCNIIFFMFE